MGSGGSVSAGITAGVAAAAADASETELRGLLADLNDEDRAKVKEALLALDGGAEEPSEELEAAKARATEALEAALNVDDAEEPQKAVEAEAGTEAAPVPPAPEPEAAQEITEAAPVPPAPETKAPQESTEAAPVQVQSAGPPAPETEAPQESTEAAAGPPAPETEAPQESTEAAPVPPTPEPEAPQEIISYPGLTDEQVANVKKAFKASDTNGSDAIEANELKVIMSALGHNMNDEEVNNILAKLDINGDGKLQFEEYLKMVAEALTGGK